ncbi:MAG: hypothetical protein LBM59_03690 [Ruminococcus sp.]|jgi:hypothetical protein|nr:hypothetical protein [Ruminococcus sp.]
MGKIKNALREAVSPVTETVGDIKNNPRFIKKLDLSFEAIRDGSDEYKRECLALVESRRGAAFKFSGVFCVVILAYIAVYALVGANAALANMPHPFGELDMVQLLLPLIIIPSVIASFVRPAAIVTTIILYFLAATYFLITFHFLAVIPFLIAGGVIFMRLSRVCEAYDCLQKLPGFPDFMPLTVDIIEKKSPIFSETGVTLDFSDKPETPETNTD